MLYTFLWDCVYFWQCMIFFIIISILVLRWTFRLLVHWKRTIWNIIFEILIEGLELQRHFGTGYLEPSILFDYCIAQWSFRNYSYLNTIFNIVNKRIKKIIEDLNQIGRNFHNGNFFLLFSLSLSLSLRKLMILFL